MLIECAISYASLDCLKVIHAARPKTKTRSTLAVDIAIENSDTEVVHYIVEKKLGPWSRKILDKVCLEDKIDTASLLLEHGDIKPSEHVLDHVAECGQFEMVKLLHKHGASCTSAVLREAAGNGYLDVARFLCEHRSECNESEALIRAAKKGRLTSWSTF